MKKMKENTGKTNRNRIFFVVIGLAALALIAYRFWLHYAGNAVEQGKIAYEQRNYDMAIASYSRAIMLGYERDSSLLWRGRAYYYGKKDFDAAIADFTKAIELRPDYSSYYLWRGRAYHQKQEYTSAIADFTEAINLDSTQSYGGHNKFIERAAVYYVKGDYDLAILDYNRAIAEIDAMIAGRLQYNAEYPGQGWDNNEELYKWRSEAIAQKTSIERRSNNPGTVGQLFDEMKEIFERLFREE